MANAFCSVRNFIKGKCGNFSEESVFIHTEKSIIEKNNAIYSNLKYRTFKNIQKYFNIKERNNGGLK